MEALLGEGKEVVLVTSGAVGVGRQKLRFQKAMRSSFADLQKPQGELGGKPCAAIGQSGLMALYDALFGQVIFIYFGKFFLMFSRFSRFSFWAVFSGL